ncbi:zf-HC2 domain-containing protein, partial [Cereibacter johrii]|uniref:zf-HC2 domain-containing protein n=1 Tax=Cereibacter johrii TaxID=445629 RepID=UPI000AB02B25
MRTMHEPVTELDLVAYVDDQLDPWRRVAVERHLATDPEAAARVMADLQARDELRLAFAEPLPHEADQLDPWRRVAVERHLATDPEAAARVMADLQARDELRLAFAEPLPHEAP